MTLLCLLEYYSKCNYITASGHNVNHKSRTRETNHLSTDADSSTDAIGGWTKNTPKPDFFEKLKKKHPKCKNSKTSREMPKLAIHPLTRGL